MARPRKLVELNRYTVRYFCSFSQREYSYTLTAVSPQEAADKCREINGIATGADIRIMDVSEVRVCTDWD